MRGLRDAELGERVALLRDRVSEGASLDAVLPEAFALVSAACVRVTGEKVAAVQMVAGAAQHFGMVAEVKDGEGRHVVTMLTAVLNALSGQCVHLVYRNDCLARRDVEWVRPVCELLGLSVGMLEPGDETARRDSYLADLTYGAAHEFVRDYLRDNLVQTTSQRVQRGLECAVVDDIDAVLVDDSLIPHLITASVEDSASWQQECARVAQRLSPWWHYSINAATGEVSLTDAGVRRLRTELGIEDVFDPASPVIYHIRNALRAKDLYRRGWNYEVVDGKVVPLDWNAGELVSGRVFNSPFLRVLEAKENLPVEVRQLRARTVTRSYFRLYRKLAGLSGAAVLAAEELAQLYGVQTVEIPTRCARARVDHDDRVFRTDADLYRAVIDAILERHRAGQPVVVGAAMPGGVERIARAMTSTGVPYRVADGHDPEHDIDAISSAGQPGAVTIMTAQACRDPNITLGRLVVIGAGRHRSRRHDERFRGLAGRKGAPGECAFFVSWEDLLRWEGEVPRRVLGRIASSADRAGSQTGPDVSAFIGRRQRDCGADSSYRRQIALEFEDVWDTQCREFHQARRQIQTTEHIVVEFLHLIHVVIDDLVAVHGLVGGGAGPPSVRAMLDELSELYPVGLTPQQVNDAVDESAVITVLHEDATHAYRTRLAQVARDSGRGPEFIPEWERRILLEAHDEQWSGHLENMEALHADIVSSRLPDSKNLTDFRNAAADLYQGMMSDVVMTAVGVLFHLGVKPT